jgi:hypothetical protein
MSDEDADAVAKRVLGTMFDKNSCFRPSKLSWYLYFGTVENQMWGAVNSSKQPPQYPNFIVNKDDLEMIVHAYRIGKLNYAYVVLSERNDLNSFTFLGCLKADAVYELLKDTPTRMGPSGRAYWLLPASITKGVEEEDPFYALAHPPSM